MGIQTPDSKRVVNSQKCIRVSGKHNDLEEVGIDTYHHTFFEMLGNWSFGDYFKREAILWAWEFLTGLQGIDPGKLYATVFEGNEEKGLPSDEEAARYWREEIGLPPDRVLYFSTKHNFWEMADIGPCGPCSEIHIDLGTCACDREEISGHQCQINGDCGRYVELWNLVFIQFNRLEDGSLQPLPEKHVDTGMGLERLVAVIQGKDSNYETDLFSSILDELVCITGKELDFKNGIPHRVIADHLRMLSFSLADGAMPGNEGRGYVLRRVLRRSARFGRMLEMKDPFLYQLVGTLCQIMGEAFPELIEKQKHIEKVIQAEETSFNETLDRGLEVYNKITENLASGSVIKGDDAFKLYDTFGFPLDLTELMARENGIIVDVKKFEKCMIEQKELARASGRFHYKSSDANWTIVGKETPTSFTGYEKLESKANLIKYKQNEDHYEIILDKTPFYAESGGQIGDMGTLSAGNFSFKVENVQKFGDEFIHIGKIESGTIQDIHKVDAKINEDRRQQIRRNHTATHLLHQALKEILGEHVQQAGSLVASESLRFDLTHYEQISNSQIEEIEACVNSVILQNKVVETEIKNYKEAREEGAVSLFGEKYGDVVRVVNVPGFSKELCGGTHVNRTGDIGGFKIISESALAAGVRRLIAVSGDAIPSLLSKHEHTISEICSKLKCSEEEILTRLQSLISDKKNLEKENKELKQSFMIDRVDELVANAEDLGDLRLVVQKVDDPGDLKELGDQFRQAFKSCGVSLIGTIQREKPMVMCAVTDDLTSQIQAGKVVKEVGGIMGGGGGGKPHIATAGGSDINLLQDALDHGKKMIQTILSNS